MPGFLYHVNATAICPHGGQVSVVSTNTRVMVSGQPVATMGDTHPISGCPLENRCVKVQWTVPASRLFVCGQPVILTTSTGVCISGGGSTIFITTQTRVSGL